MKEKIIKIIADTLEIDKKKIQEETNLLKDLEIESLDLVDLISAFEEEFNCNIPDSDIKNLQTVKDIINYIEEHNV